MNDIKLICVDMDGTLLGNDHKPTKENIEALRAAEKAGIKICIATGRTPSLSLQVARDISKNMHLIAINGAIFCDINGDILPVAPMTKELALEVLNEIDDFEYQLMMCTDGSVIICDKTQDEQIINRYQNLYDGFPDFKYLKIDNAKEYVLAQDENFKVVSVSGKKNEEAVKIVRDKLNKTGRFSACSSFYDNIEVTQIGVSKGDAVEALCKKLGISIENCMAFGDSLNDLSMLQTVGYSVAMGNAAQELKDVAKYITDSNNNSGVAKAIYEIIGIGVKYL